MGPAVAYFTQLLHQRALGAPKRAPKDVVPRVPHRFEQNCGVPLCDWLLRVQPIIRRQQSPRFRQRLVLMDARELTFNVRRQPCAQQLHRFADALVIGDGHVLLFLCVLSFRFRQVPLAARCPASHC